jgi:hypothetical protein
VVLLNNRLNEFVTSTWTDESIERRTQSLIDVILAIWPVPEGHVIDTLSQDGAAANDLTLRDLVLSGVIKEGEVLVPAYQDLQHCTAVLLADGRIKIEDKVFDTPSGAGSHVRNGRATNGYTFWLVGGPDGPSLRVVRRKYFELKQSGESFDSIDFDDLLATDETESVRELQLKFWQGFNQHVADCGSPFTTKAPRRQSWSSIAIGTSIVHIDAIFTSFIGTMVATRPDETGPELRVDFYIYDNDELFQRLLKQQAEIELEYGAPLRFYSAPGVASRRVFDFIKTDVTDQSRWPEYYDWLTERVIRMREVMVKRL